MKKENVIRLFGLNGQTGYVPLNVALDKRPGPENVSTVNLVKAAVRVGI